MSRPPGPSYLGDLANLGRGLLMGGADIIPGVSGGTVALILGIYERLVTAISHFDLKLLGHLRHGRWAEAFAHIDLRFLVVLGGGILLGVASLASLMHHLLEHHREPTWAFFFGLILASSVLVFAMVELWSLLSAFALVAGALFAWWLVGLVNVTPMDGLGYIFVCGLVAICAMILPGISGALILLILGRYDVIVGALKGLLSGEFSAEALATLSVFGTGAVIGLLSFSKLLRWLLARHEPMTMAALCGIMLGSLRKVWPFKVDTTPGEPDFKRKIFENTRPESFADALLPLGLALAGIALVYILDRLTRVHRRVPPLEPADHEPRPEA